MSTLQRVLAAIIRCAGAVVLQARWRKRIFDFCPDRLARVLDDIVYPGERDRLFREAGRDQVREQALRICRLGFLEAGLRDMKNMARGHSNRYVSYYSGWWLAYWFLAIGERESALEWAQHALKIMHDTPPLLVVEDFHKTLDELGVSQFADVHSLFREIRVIEDQASKPEVSYDVVLVSDFCLPGGTNVSNVEEIKAQKNAGLRTGLVHWPRYSVDPERPFNPKLLNAIDGDAVVMLGKTQRIRSKVVIVRHPPVLLELSRFLPEIKADHYIVVINQTPKLDYTASGMIAFDISRCEQNAHAYFGQAPMWYPNSPIIRSVLETHHGNELNRIRLADENWGNIIDVDEWKRLRRPDKRDVVKIGRHGRNDGHKWLKKKDELLASLPCEPRYEVLILGGARVPIARIGYQPENWHVYEFGEIAPREFLRQLDVFIYFTSPELNDAFPRVILEAMAVGVPVILPEKERPIFGCAALYAKPCEVRGVVDYLMNDDIHYQRQVEVAWKFLQAHCSHSRHIDRLLMFCG